MAGITQKSCGALLRLWSLQKSKKENKTKLNGFSDLEESLFWSNSKSICSNSNNKINYNDNSQ